MPLLSLSLLLLLLQVPAGSATPERLREWQGECSPAPESPAGTSGAEVAQRRKGRSSRDQTVVRVGTRGGVGPGLEGRLTQLWPGTRRALGGEIFQNVNFSRVVYLGRPSLGKMMAKQIGRAHV